MFLKDYSMMDSGTEIFKHSILINMSTEMTETLGRYILNYMKHQNKDKILRGENRIQIRSYNIPHH